MRSPRTTPAADTTARAAVLLGALGLVCLLLLDGCKRPGIDDDNVIARINGRPLTVQDFTAAVHRLKLAPLKPGQPIVIDSKLKALVLRDLIDRQLILQRARKLGLSVSPQELALKLSEVRRDYRTTEAFHNMIVRQYIEFNTWKQEVRTQLLIEKVINIEVYSKIQPTEEQIKAYYRKHGPQYHVSAAIYGYHVLVHDPQQAQKLRALLVAGRDLATLIGRFKIPPEQAYYGRPTLLQLGQMPRRFDAQLVKLAIGRWSPVIKTVYGWHLVKILKRVGAGQKPLAQVRRNILTQLNLELQERALAKWMNRLRRRADIRINKSFLPPEDQKRINTPKRSKT
ncbi:MAG: SurA N-terminal domain-containing protein [Proteobacteria bacterium]|nr:SurA N-terminal domain-containing protein [Pseudomonadota bacterium]MBU1742108.1 SurA N-terminal domain-containing protein [Pseudomonadota bacterium]